MYPNNIHNTVTSNHFTRYDASTPYGSDNNHRVSFSTPVNIMGTSATTSQVDEDNILVSSLGTGSGNAIRVDAGATLIHQLLFLQLLMQVQHLQFMKQL